MLPSVIGGPGGEGMTASPKPQDTRRFCNPHLFQLTNADDPQIVRRFPARAGTSAANYAQFLSPEITEALRSTS
jgi:hypothetical protein